MILTASAPALNPPFLDTNALVKGSADATKLLRFEVDGFTAGVTRVMTPPNQDATIAGLEVIQTFTRKQSIQSTSNEIQFQVTGHAAQSNPFIELLNSALATVFRVDQNGTPTSPTASILLATHGEKFGNGATGNALRSSSFGHSAAATGDRSSAFGFGAVANSDRSIAIGSQASATGTRSCAIGESALTTANNSFALGSASVASDINTVAIGQGATATVRDSIAIGRIANAGFTGCIVLGEAAIATKVQQLIFGSATSPINEFSFPGGSFAYRAVDTATDTVANVATFRQNKSSAPGVGFGLGLLFQGKSSTTENQDMGRLTYEWATATHAIRKALGKLTAFDAATEREAIQWGVDGTNPTLGLLGATAIARPATYTLAATATRVMPTPEAAFTGIDNAQAGAVYAQVADLNILQTRVNSIEGVLRQVIIDLASTSGYGLLVAS